MHSQVSKVEVKEFESESFRVGSSVRINLNYASLAF